MFLIVGSQEAACWNTYFAAVHFPADDSQDTWGSILQPFEETGKTMNVW